MNTKNTYKPHGKEENMKVLNLLQSATVGGIEELCKNIAKIAIYDNAFVFLFQEGLIYEEMKNNGANVCSLSEYGSKKINKKRLSALKKLAEPFDIIVVHHSALAIQMCYVYLKRIYPDKKFVLIAHSCFDKKYDYDSYTNPIKRFLRKKYICKSLAISDKLVFVSEAGRHSYTAAFKISEDKTAVIYNGIFLPNLQNVQRNKRIQNEPYRITFIGRLEEIKGVQNLIQAISILKTKGITCQAYICGDGSYRNTLERLSTELHTDMEVHFEGTQRNIQKYLCNTDVFVYPSICEEVFGISIVEALSYGIPCVANQVGGIPEILDDNQNGVLTKEKTAKSLSEAIERVLKWYENGEIKTIQKNCIETAEKFTVQKTVENYKRLFEEII